MKIGMSLDGDRFLARESILLQVSLENASGGPVDVPNPEDLRNPQYRYRVQGPAYPHGHVFEPRVKLPDPNSPGLLKMGPGEQLQAQLPLNVMFSFKQPGTYALTAQYEWGGQRQSFGPISFVIEAGTLKSARVMADFGFQKPNLQRVLGLVGHSPRLYQFLFHEPRAAEIAMLEMMRGSAAPADAAQALAPCTNFNRADVFFARFGWQSPAAVGLESVPEGGSAKAALAGGAAPVTPALMTEDGDAAVFTHTGSSVSLVRFPMPRKGAAPDGHVQWTVQAPGEIRAAAAALGPQPRNELYALTVSAKQSGAQATVFEGEKGNHRTVDVDGRILPDSEPALWVDERGTVNAAVLLAEDEARRRVFLAELVWEGGNGHGKVTRHPAAEIPGNFRAAAVTYSVAPGRPPRLAWLVLLEDWRVVTNLSGEAYRTARTPLVPLQMLAMSGTTYLLVADPEDYVGFDVLR